MKQLKVITLGLVFMTICCNLLAQNPSHYFDKQEDRLTKMAEELNLTPEQTEQVKTIHEKYASQLKELRQNNRKIRQQNFEEMRTIFEAQQSELQQILTKEQITALQEKRREYRKQRHFQHRRQHFDRKGQNRANRKVLREEIRTYVLQNALPVLKSQRVKLDSELEGNDKAMIEDLRSKFETIKPQLKAARKDFREALMNGKKPTEELAQLNTLKEAYEADRTQIRALADKYGVQIEALKKEIEGDIQQWRTKIQALVAKHVEEQDKPIGHFHHRSMRHHHHRHFSLHRMLSKVGFLLLDPNKDYTFEGLEQEERSLEERRINVFPNPTVQVNTIEFEVQKAGNVRIDLMSRNGAFIRTILDEYKSEGTHQVKVDITNLSDQMYFYRISDASGEVTKEFLINN